MHLSIRERIRAAFVILFFTFTNLLPSGFSQVSSVSPERIPLPHLELNLPPELGRVEDFYVPNAADSSPFIIHVQSAHGDVETQKKIKEILRFLRDSLGIRLVFAEGASEPLRPELLKFFSDPPTNLRMADLLLQKGIYTGVDLFLLDPNGVDTLGIENSRFYRTAYENFKKVLLNSEPAESKIKQIELGLDRAASKTLSKDSFSLVKNWQKFQERQLDLLPSAHFLAGHAKRDLKLDLADPFSQLEWPQFVRLARLEEFEKNLDREKLEEERRKIDRSFGKLSPNDDEIPDPRRTFEHFLEKAFPLGFRFEDYPNFTRWIGSLILRAELDGRILSQEFDRLWHHLKDSEAKTEEEREFFRRYENLILLKKLLHLELTREEWGKINGLQRKLLSPTQLGPKAVLEILGFRGWENPAKGAKRGTGWAPSTESRRFLAKRPAVEKAIFSRSVFSALRFYRLTERRESIFFKTLAREMKTRKQTKAILVTGGFHTPGLAHIFKEKGFGYAVITPRMDKDVDSDIYRKTMLDLSQMEIIEFAQRSEARAIQGRNIEKEEALVRSLFGEVALGSSRRGPLHWEDTAYVRDLRDEIKIPSRAEVRKARDSSEPHHDFQQRAEKWNLPGSQKTSGIGYPLGPPKYSGSLGFSSPEGKGVSDSLQGVGSAYRLSFEEGREVSGGSDESSRRQRPSRMKGAEEALYRPVTDHAAPPLVSSRSTLHPLPSLGPKPGLVQVKSGTGLQKESKPQDLFHFRGAQPIQDSRNRPRNLGHRFHRKVNGNTIPASKQPSRRAAIIGPKGPLTARGEVRQTPTGFGTPQYPRRLAAGTEVRADSGRMFSVRVQPDLSYEVKMTRGIFEVRNPLLKREIQKRRALFVVDGRIGAAQIAKIKNYIKARKIEGAVLILPGGEQVKNEKEGRENVDRITGAAEKIRLSRKDVFVLVGGGAVLDVGGFAASIFHRGIPYVRIPTTLLAQIDAGIGVKTGINYFGQKNFYGTFYPAQSILVDPLLLTTLDERQMRSGLAEAIKVALMKDADYFGLIERNYQDLLARNFGKGGRAGEIMWLSIVRHLEQIGTDPFERLFARPLDYGHEWGHRLEIISDYEITHGEGVAIGMAIDTHISYQRGLITKEELERVLGLIERIGLPLYDPLATVKNLWPGLESFRRHLGGSLTVSLLDGIGAKRDVHEISREELATALRFLKSRAEARQVLRPPAVPEQPAPARAEARQVLRPPAVPEQPAPARAAIIGPKGPLTARGEVRQTPTGFGTPQYPRRLAAGTEVRPPLKIGGRGEQPAEATRDKLSTRFVKTNPITRTLLKPLSSPAEILADPRVREEIWELSGKEIRPETAFRLGKAIGVFHPKYSKEVLLMMLRALRVGDRQIRQERIPVYLRKIIEDLRARGISLEEKNQETGAQISIYDHVPTRSEFAALVFAQAMIPLPDLPAEVVIYPARELSSQALTRLQRSEAQIKKMKNIEGKPIQIHFFYHIQPRKISQYFQKIASSLTARLRQRLGQDARTHIVVTLTEDLARRLEAKDSSLLLPLYGIKQVRYGTPKNPSYYSALPSAAVSLSKRDYESLQGLDRLILERQTPFLYASRYDRVPGDWQEIWPFAQARILEEAFAAAA